MYLTIVPSKKSTIEVLYYLVGQNVLVV